MCAIMLRKNPSNMIGPYIVIWLFSQILDINIFEITMKEEILEKKEQKLYQEVKGIAMNISLSVQSKCFENIIWLDTFIFHNTDYQHPRLLHLYGRDVGVFSFFRSMHGKNRFIIIKMYKDSSNLNHVYSIKLNYLFAQYCAICI